MASGDAASPVFAPMAQSVVQADVQPVVQQVVQPVAQPINTTGGQFVRMPDGKLFMLPSNTYPVLQPVEDQPMTLQTVTVEGTNNKAFKETP